MSGERSRPNGNGVGVLPSWARIVRDIGFPIFAALVFMAVFLGYLPSPLTRLEALTLSHVRDDASHRFAMYRICKNTAPSAAHSDECEKIMTREGLGP